MEETILVVEDETDVRDNIQDILECKGYKVLTAENGQSAMEYLNREIPDMIICDIMMPLMNGFELLEELQKDRNKAKIPFIFLTAKVETENFRKGMNLGADDYIFKPFDIEELLNAISTRLGKKNVSWEILTEMQEQISLKIPHELRTPLVHILGFAEIIEDEEDINEIKGMVKKIRTSGKELHRKIEKLLLHQDLIVKQYRTDKRKPFQGTVITEESLFACVSKLSAELEPVERVKVTVETQTVPINEWLLQQLVKELVENGLKYSDSKCKVYVRGYLFGEYYIITVSDSGRGMDTDEISFITAFNKFGESRLSENGLGLGLAIAEKITRLYSGYLKIKSEINTFTTCEAAIRLMVNC